MQQNGTSERNLRAAKNDPYDFITARNGTHRFQLRRQFPSRFHCIAVIRQTGHTASKYCHNREPNLSIKWIGQK
jgi:hypothetical protein